MRAHEQPALIAAARWGLTDPLDAVIVDAQDLGSVGGAVATDRLGGLLYHAIADSWVVADERVLASVRDTWNAQLLASVVCEALAVRTAAILDSAGVRWRLTKGAALAHLDYPDPSLRPFGDVDVVIHPDDWATAMDALAKAGNHRPTRTLPGDYDRRFGKGATLKTPEGLELDAHVRFAVGRFGIRSRMVDLFASGDEITLAGRRIPTLDPPGRLLHACHHAALGGQRQLRAHRDVAQLILVSQADWQTTVEIARRWRVEAVVARAVTEAWLRLHLTEPHPAWQWAASYHEQRIDRWALDVFGQERPFREQALTTLTSLPMRDVPAYVAAVYSGSGTRNLLEAWRRRLRDRFRGTEGNVSPR